ncbi:MAG: hypothetical protein M1829_005656 [Trizodia sp. TS-e1964]|nr:MAG: hypothetical protein M1829_005656 [Trizodia sp. TS-e1964]
MRNSDPPPPPPIIPPPMASITNRRAQPLRQTRTNPPRNSTTLPRHPLGASPVGERPDAAASGLGAPRFFPAITHFTESIAALPKEMARHFTLLKEVDAQACGPEESLGHILNLLQKLDPPAGDPVRASNYANPQEGAAPGVGQNPFLAQDASESSNQTFDDPASMLRRRAFLNLRFVIQDMLKTLDEKNHVLSTATDHLNKQLLRINSSYPHIEGEISEEARLGSLSHWAYLPKGTGKAAANTTTNERSRREISNLAAAAAVVHDGEVALSRSESRREALLARKSRNQHVDSDFDDGHGQHNVKARESAAVQTAQGTAPKRNHGAAKAKRAAEIAAAHGGQVVEGLNGNGATNGNVNPQAKRRKTEKAANIAASHALERSMSGVFGSHNTTTMAHVASPRQTPGPEGVKRRARGGGAQSGGTRKRGTTGPSATQSPLLATSPVLSTFVAAQQAQPNSTVGVASRPGSSRARKNSAHSILQDAPMPNARQRPPSSSSSRFINSNGISLNGPDLSNATGSLKSKPEANNKTSEQAAEQPPVENSRNGIARVGSQNSNKSAEARSPKKEEVEATNEAMQGITPAILPPPPISTAAAANTRGSTRGSKTSTPTTTTFSESNLGSRSRQSRANDVQPPKRSHKKGAGAAAQQLIAASTVTADEEGSSMQGDDEDDEEGEPRYCYCNQISFGEMVACDNPKCSREWFHLECAGLSRAPLKNAKWYCEPCEKSLQLQATKDSGKKPKLSTSANRQ